mgnify:CR=1 FL=1
MKLRNKLVIAQLCVFLVIMGILLMALPELVYRNISVKDREDTMILNEQIMSQLDQNFEELVRFTKIVAEEPELIQKIDQYMSEPNEANNAKISLFLSRLGVKNKIQSYGIIGIYLDHLLDARQLPDAAQDLQIVAVVHDHVGAGGGGQAVLAAIAHAPQHLLPAGREPEVGGGAADIVDVALEIRLVGHPFGLGHNAVGTAAGDPAALMQLDGAEVAAAEAAAVLDDGELHLPDGRHAAHALVDGVVAAGVGQRIHLVQLPAHQRLCRDVLHKVLFTLLLDNDLAADHILIVHLDAAGSGVGHLIGGHFPETGALHILFGQVVEVGQVAGAVHIGDGLHRLPCRQPPGDLHGLVLAHAKADEIGSGVLCNAGQNGVQPVIVVGKPAQRSLQTAQDHRQVGVGLLGQPGVNGGAAVRPRAADAAGRVFVLGTRNFCHGVVAHHAVHVAAADEKAVLRPAEPLEVLAVGIAGLGQHADLIALGLQQAADDGGAKAGVVNVGIAAHHHKVQLIPAPGFHIRPADGKKFGVDRGSIFLHILYILTSHL